VGSQQRLHDLRVRQQSTAGTCRHITKGIQSKFDYHCHPIACLHRMIYKRMDRRLKLSFDRQSELIDRMDETMRPMTANAGFGLS
jgi:hypothetical protein